MVSVIKYNIILDKMIYTQQMINNIILILDTYTC